MIIGQTGCLIKETCTTLGPGGQMSLGEDLKAVVSHICDSPVINCHHALLSTKLQM
jgi:hypothetical protein